MLQQGLILYTVHEQGAGKHGPRWRAQNRMAKETNSEPTIAPLKRAKQPADCICKEGAVHNMAIRLNTSASAKESTSLKFGWVKICSIYTPHLPPRLHRMIRAGESRTFGSTYRVQSGGGLVEESSAVDWRCVRSCFLLSPVVLLP